MSYYNACPICGSNLDPGEICGCAKEKSPCATNTGAQGAPKSTQTQDQYIPSAGLEQEYFEYARRITGIMRDYEGPYTEKAVSFACCLWTMAARFFVFR